MGLFFIWKSVKSLGPNFSLNVHTGYMNVYAKNHYNCSSHLVTNGHFLKCLILYIFIQYIYIYPQNLSASMEGRPGPCCYDFKWSEITARGDWRPEPLLFWYQMKFMTVREDQKLVAPAQWPPLTEETKDPLLLQDAIKMHFKIFCK